MSTQRVVGVGVVGIGFIGHTHVRAYDAAGARLVAVCDVDAEQMRGRAARGGNLKDGRGEITIDPGVVRIATGLDEFLATPGLELVSVCTPTDTHRAVAVAALRAGKHVLVEKPVALDVRTVAEIRDEAARSGRLCMPAMCMRFWPAWARVKEAIDDGRFGRVRAMRLERLGAPPAWAHAFYEDESRSGAALFDLHVHDTDFVVHCFGVPTEVLSVGDTRHLTSVYRFEDGPAHVVAQGGWMNDRAWTFRMRFIVEFERAVADFDIGRSPQLIVRTAEGEPATPEVASMAGWEGEIRAMVSAVAEGRATPPATMDSAMDTTRTLEAERESLRTGGAVRVEG